jgi:hypothetical protein
VVDASERNELRMRSLLIRLQREWNCHNVICDLLGRSSGSHQQFRSTYLPI